MNDLVQRSDDRIIAQQTGMVGHVVINNPEKHNAISLDMWRSITRTLQVWSEDSTIRLIVISGAGGRAFASGADISRFESERSEPEAVKTYNAASKAACSALYNFPKPTIAKIRGYCIGGGMNIATCCDLRLASDNSKFGIPAAKLGLGYGFEGVKRLSRLIGVSRAMELFYTARKISAQEAHQFGFLNHITPACQLEEEVDRWSQEIVENAPLTIAAIKQVALNICEDPASRNLAQVEQMVETCFTSQDYVEGRRAFLEKRKPIFNGC